MAPEPEVPGLRELLSPRMHSALTGDWAWTVRNGMVLEDRMVSRGQGLGRVEGSSSLVLPPVTYPKLSPLKSE